MKCRILFSGKNMKNIVNLLFAELAERVVKVNKGYHICPKFLDTFPYNACP